MLGVRLSEDLSNRLSLLAASTHRPKSFYVKEALEHYLDANEELYKTISTYEEQKKNGTLQLITLDEIKKKYDLA